MVGSARSQARQRIGVRDACGHDLSIGRDKAHRPKGDSGASSACSKSDLSASYCYG